MKIIVSYCINCSFLDTDSSRGYDLHEQLFHENTVTTTKNITNKITKEKLLFLIASICQDYSNHG